VCFIDVLLIFVNIENNLKMLSRTTRFLSSLSSSPSSKISFVKSSSSPSFTFPKRFSAADPLTKPKKQRDAEFIPEPSKLYATVSTPTVSLIRNKEVQSVSVPAVDGMLEFLYAAVPSLTELKPGPLLIKHTDGTIDKYFVSSGFAFMTKDSFCNVNVIEAVKYADMDPASANQGLKQAEAELAAATTPEAKLKAQIELETFSNVLLEIGAK